MKIAVLMGGWSNEREVSLSTGNCVVTALKELNHDVFPIDVNADLELLIKTIKDINPERIFNALHGIGGEDGTLQGVLNLLKIPYTHSGVLASALSMDKWISAQIFKTNGLNTPLTYKLKLTEAFDQLPLEFPFVVKPVCEGSSVGLYFVNDYETWRGVLNEWGHGDDLLVQEYIVGQEIHVPVLNGKAINTVEVVKSRPLFDYTAKYTPGYAEFISPARHTEKIKEMALEMAETAFMSLKCRGLARVDMLFVEEKGYILELNTQPGLTPMSLAPRAAKTAGITFPQLVQHLLDLAACD